MKKYKRYLYVNQEPVIRFCNKENAMLEAELSDREVLYNETSMRNFNRSQEFLRRKFKI